MANIPGINTRTRPGVFVRQSVRTNNVQISGGERVPLIMGEGLAEETVITAAQGNGLDGENSYFAATGSPDGRHFQLAQVNLVENRTVILKNGVPLTIKEESVSVDPLDTRYDCRLDTVNGRIQLQGASLVDFDTSGGSPVYYKSYSTNTGNGTIGISASGLLSANAPAETWIIRCTKVVLNGLGDPVSGQAIFTVTGSVSGAIKDSSGNQITWKSNGVTVSNTILSFSIVEGSTPFRQGDKFSIEVRSGVLAANDTLTAKYIPESFLNDPTEFSNPEDLFAKHGQPSATNTLSLGAAMAFENGASSVMALQCKPSVPRKTTETLIAADDPLSVEVTGASGDTDMEDCIFPLNIGAVPDLESNINIFIVTSDGTETQKTLNKVTFFDSDTYGTTMSAAFTNFCEGETYSYTVLMLPEVEQSGSDGYIYEPGDGYTYFTSETGSFSADRGDAGEGDLDKYLVAFDSASGNIFGKYAIVEVGDGYGDNTLLQISLDSGTAQLGENLSWQLVDEADQSANLLLTTDFVDENLIAGVGLKISYVDTKDAAFFDTNWLSGFEAAELVSTRYIVPLPTQTISNIFGVAKSHVITQSNILNAQERILICGAINGLLPENLDGSEDAAVEDIGLLEGIQGDDAEEVLNGLTEDLANYSIADAFGDTQRVIYMVPDQIVRNIAGTNTVLSGYFSAAAMAGFLSSKSSLAEPATNKTLVGFAIPNTRRYRPTVINNLLEAGACILEQVSGGGRIVHGITTANSGAPEDEEISIVEIRDQVVNVMRSAMRPYVGRINSGTIIQEISAAADKVMRAMVAQGLLTGFSGLSVVRDLADTTQINIGVRAFPAGPVNSVFADIEFTLGG